MNTSKSKKIKKLLKQLQLQHSFRKPLQILFDFESLALCEKTKITVRLFFKQINDARLFTTACIFEEVFRKLKDEGTQTHMDAHVEIRKCKHIKKRKNVETSPEKNNSETQNGEQIVEKTEDKFIEKNDEKSNDKTDENPAEKQKIDRKIECLKYFLRQNNSNHYILACTNKSAKLYSKLKNVPLIIVKKGGTFDLSLDNFEINESKP